MEVPKILPKFTQASVSKAGFLNTDDLKNLLNQTLIFTAPIAIAFLLALQAGKTLEQSLPYAYIAIVQVLLNYFLKLNNGSK